jgi:hypothetical protein
MIWFVRATKAGSNQQQAPQNKANQQQRQDSQMR